MVARSGFNALMEVTFVLMAKRALNLNGRQKDLSEHFGFLTLKVSFQLKLKSRSSQNKPVMRRKTWEII